MRTKEKESLTLRRNKNVNADSFANSILGRILVLFAVIFIVGCVLVGRIFYMQIVNGQEALDNFTLKIQKERTIEASRGKIYDRNGKLLAYNELAYNVTIEDTYESGKDKNSLINNTLIKVMDVCESNGDSMIGDFNIILNENNEYEYTVSGTKLLRFLADIYGQSEISDLKYEQQNATADEVIDYLCGYKVYGIGEYTDPDNPNDTFQTGVGYTKKQILQLVTIRYAMSLNSYQKYIPTVIANDVDEKTVATLLENSDELQGIAIEEDNIRKYNDSVYFAQIMGYTGKISEDELYTLNTQEITEDNIRTTRARSDYVLTDSVGKSGIEQTMETYLAGTKGSETVYVNNLGKVIESTKTVDPIAGNDVYLTIDRDLQVAVYDILEQSLAGILVSKLQNVKEYHPTESTKAKDYIIPITDVYNSLFSNNVIDLEHLGGDDAQDNERAVYNAFLNKRENVFDRLREELDSKETAYCDLSDEYKVYESYITTMLTDNGVIISDSIDTEDETYLSWKVEETISLSEYLRYCIAMNWIDVSRISLDNSYSDSNEVYERLVDYIIEKLYDSKSFAKKLYKYMILNDDISYRQVCMLLIEQEAVTVTDEVENKFESGATSPYDFTKYLIENLYITPAQLALDPFSASCVVTNTEGEVLALVSYPSYDNNRLANSIDAQYYASLQSDLSKPLWNYATQQKTAPGSTFKMVTATAALEEGLITSTSTHSCTGVFDKFEDTQYHCWIYPGSHGLLNVSGAIQNSCNCFFYEMGYELSLVGDRFDEATGLEKLAKYASMYGLDAKSGIEIEESEPDVSDEYPVPSAIGQGTNNYTTVGLARYVTAVANSGTVYDLSLLDKVTDSSGNLIVDYSPTVRNTVDLPTAHWNAIHKGMRAVVESKSYYSSLGVNVAGKTGTAQESKTRANHALFVSYAPYEDPEITVSTRIAYGYTSEYAANVTRDIYKYYYKLEDEDSILTGTATAPEASNVNAD